MTARTALNRRDTSDRPLQDGDQLLYLYAVLAPEPPVAASLAAGDIAGLAANSPLFGVEAAGLLAAVSAVPERTFGEDGLNALLGDLQQLAPFTVRHQQAVHALWQQAESIVPITFGAVYHDAGGVARLLDEGAEHFRALLEALRGKEEWGVRVRLDAARFAAVVAEQSPLLQRLAREEATATPGRAYLLRRSRERALTGEHAHLLANLVASIGAALAAHAVDVHAGAVDAVARDGAIVAANLAFLVESAAVQDFLAALEPVRQQHAAAGVLLEQSGPWAPYSFVRAAGRDAEGGAR